MEMRKQTRQIILSHSQNFLKSPRLVERLVEQSGIDPEDVVIEIGPGKGRITRVLADYCARVIAIEKDPSLYNQLVESFKNRTNVSIVLGDILSYPLPPKGRYKIFSNIPFNLTSDILSILTSVSNPPDDVHLVVQLEAAIKFSGHPYGEERLRSLQLKPWFDISITHHFRRTDFVPLPHVDIVLLRIEKRSTPLLDVRDQSNYRDFLAYTFNKHGKDLRKRLEHIITEVQFKRLSVDMKFKFDAPPGDLSVDQWTKLFTFFKSSGTEGRKRKIRDAAHALERQQEKLEKKYRTFADRKAQTKREPRSS